MDNEELTRERKDAQEMTAQLTTEQARIEELERANITLAKGWPDFRSIQQKNDTLKAQLATAQNELCTAQDQIPPDLDGDSLSVVLIKLVDQRRDLQQALNLLTRKYDAYKAVAEAHEEVLTRVRDRYRDLLEIKP